LAVFAPILAGVFTLLPERSAAAGHVDAAGRTGIWMRNIIIFPYDDAPITVQRLSGTLKPTKAGRIVDMDEVASYRIDAAHAEVRMPAASLSVLMNRYVIPLSGTRLKNISVVSATG